MGRLDPFGKPSGFLEWFTGTSPKPAPRGYSGALEKKMEARQFAANALKQAFPHLVPVSEKNNSLVAAAKNIRIELARVFPGVKFSVKSERFSMGNAVRVSWTDGPTTAQVEDITGKYDAGSFDGMTDCYNYRKDHAWTDAFGAAKYITFSRDYSSELVQKAIDYLWDRYRPEAAKITPEDYFSGGAWRVEVINGGYPGDTNAQSQIHRFAHKFDCVANALTEDYIG